MFEGGGGGVNTAAAVYELYLGVSGLGARPGGGLNWYWLPIAPPRIY